MAGESYKNIYTNLSAVLDPELYFLQENFSLPQELLMSIAPSRWTACGFAKCIHESGNSVQPVVSPRARRPVGDRE